MAYLAVLYIGYILSKIKSSKTKINLNSFLQIFFCVAIIFLTDSRTSIIAAAIFFLAFYWDLLLKNALVLLYVFSTLSLSIVFLAVFTDVFDSIIQNIFQTFTLESTYIRGNMIYLSGLIFYQFFPVGTGAASFGSVMANNKVYEYYEQADRYYFANDIGLYDSNIASIVGEYGFIGLIFYFLLFFYTYRYLAKTFRTRGVMLKSVFFVFLFYTITNPMITNNVYILISLPVFLKIASINNTNTL
ncbi:O-antigen ligase family protein [Psychroflexus sp. CAK8W]|uniref:O-antigen ligase family protein n=1 Tax=Psychroflexus longus TaxID=2873596 RepID=A0ABS7XG77_9FLAO|nr:O-antigen ligase family protein [Psychroflexus longus]MBZ9777938.1 O-antigen ligase family protein [Psychroflexus longus]